MKEEFEVTKVVTGICIYQEEQTIQGKKKKYKRTNNDLQNIHIFKTKDRVTRTPLISSLVFINI